MSEAEKKAKERMDKLKEYDEQKSKIQDDLNKTSLDKNKKPVPF